MDPEQTLHVLLTRLDEGLNEVLSVMTQHSLPLKYVVKYLMALDTPGTRMREVEAAFESYAPEGKDADTVLREIKECVLLVLSEAVVGEMGEGEKRDIRVHLFLDKLDQV